MHVRSEHGGYYTCRAKRRGTGLCDARAVPATQLDERGKSHLNTFLESVEGWIADQLDRRDSGRTARQDGLDAARAALAKLDIDRDKLLDKVREYLTNDQEAKADVVLAAVEKLDAEREARQREVADAEAALAEFQATPDVDQALDYYRELSEAIAGRTSGSRTVAELRSTLSTILAGVWVRFDGDMLDARFSLRGLDDHPQASAGARDMADYAERIGEPDKRWMLDPVGWLSAKAGPDDDGDNWPEPNAANIPPEGDSGRDGGPGRAESNAGQPSSRSTSTRSTDRTPKPTLRKPSAR